MPWAAVNMKANLKAKVARAAKAARLPPGSLVYLGERRVDKVTISVIDYNETAIRETLVDTPEDCREYIGSKTVTWINVTGLHDPEILTSLGSIFGFHPLMLEDIIHTGQRPKFEDHGEYVFCTIQMLYHSPGAGDLVSEQVSMILGDGYLFTFQEKPGDVFEMLRDRIRTGKGKIRSMGCDYLAYAILDAIVDNCFVVLEDIDEKVDTVQAAAEDGIYHVCRQAIYELRRDLALVHRTVWPLREVVSAFSKAERRLIRREIQPYLRNLYEHTIQVIDSAESLRDMAGAARDVYMTAVGNHTNDIMRVLTIIATVFIPLTFVAGIYGMNFEHMPELKWRFGYLVVWVVMGTVAGGMIAYFKHKRWF